MNEIIRLINNEFNPKYPLDENDIEGLRECLNMFIAGDFDDIKSEIKELKDTIDSLEESNSELFLENNLMYGYRF